MVLRSRRWSWWTGAQALRWSYAVAIVVVQLVGACVAHAALIPGGGKKENPGATKKPKPKPKHHKRHEDEKERGR